MDCHSCHNARRRSGSLLIEAAISIALLGTAMIAVTRLAQSASALNQQADQRIAAKLAAENTMERMSAVPLDQWSDQVEAVAQDVAQMSGCSIDASVEPMESPAGFHLTVTVRVTEGVMLTVHDWRLESVAETTDPTVTADDGTEAVE